MSIINKGILNSGSAYLRQVGNDWPTAQVISTAEIIESDINLFYTNSRARTAYTAGQGIAISQGGVISYKQADPGLGFYNSGLTLASAAVASNIYSNIVTFSSTDGVSFIVQSLHVTNLSPNVAYLNGRINYNYSSFSNSVVFANLLEIPGASSTELFLKPSTFEVGDQIQLQSFSNPRQPANSLISAMVSYQGSAITEYDRAATSLTSNSMSNVFTSVGKSSIIESIKVVNPNPNPATITVQIVDTNGAVFAWLASNLSIPAFSSVEVCEYPKALLTDYTIRAQKTIGFGQPINIFTSSKYTSYFVATPSSATINETTSNTVSIDFQTLGVTNGTTFYYSIDGNVQPSDFVPAANTGSFVVTNDQATINLQIAADANFGIEGTESFRVQVRKASVTGTIVATTSNITIQDTSQTTSYVVVENTSAIADRTANTVIFTIQGFNVANNSVLYYSTAGNVTASQLVTANTGTFTLVDRFANLSIVAGDIPTGETRTLQLQVRSGSNTGTILQTSNVITIFNANIAGILATGGTQTNVGGYRIHTFTTSGNFSISRYAATPGADAVEMMIVAGGGGGGAGSGSAYGAGGGAGGLIYRGSETPANGQITSAITGANLVPVISTNTAVVIGGGGAVHGLDTPSIPWSSPTPGTNSTLTTSPGTVIWVATGGGGGGSYQSPAPSVWPGSPGGSGGGGSANGGNFGTGIAGQGNPGGSDTAAVAGGGGGGAGAHGAPTTGAPTGLGGVGGIGLQYAISGTPAYYAGGGGGGGGSNLSGGLGGGGRGSGPLNTPTLYGANASVNSGGGGGGASVNANSGQGGSGIVIIRYPVI